MKSACFVEREHVNGHSPHGECGLKFLSGCLHHERYRHSPHGECGLK